MISLQLRHRHAIIAVPCIVITIIIISIIL